VAHAAIGDHQNRRKQALDIVSRSKFPRAPSVTEKEGLCSAPLERDSLPAVLGRQDDRFVDLPMILRTHSTS